MPDGVDLQLNEKVLGPLRSSVDQKLKEQLGVKELPEAVKTEIDERVKLSANDSVRKCISQIADEVVLAQAPQQQAAIQKVGRGLTNGLENIKLVSQSADYLKMLNESAKMTKAKYDALVAAGFTDDQAFRLVEAEALARSGRSR